MRVAILADIHGNLPALEEVARQVEHLMPDLVLVAGDIVNRGPWSPECLAFVQERQAQAGWQVIRGNHEGYVIRSFEEPETRAGLEGAIRQNVRWTLERLGGIEAIAALPAMLQFAGPDGGEIRLVHASMLNDRDNILPTTSDQELREKIAPAPELFCCGHTHRALVRAIDDTLVVNAGSVGLPFDGDVRAAYALATWQASRGWLAEIRRVAYDRERTARAFKQSGFLAQAGPAARLIYEEFKRARPYLGSWFVEYEQAVAAGDITAAESVSRFLATLD